LVDKIDSPKAVEVNFDWLISLFSYIVVFGAGYLSAISFKWSKKVIKKENPLVEKIKSAKDEKELLTILMANDSQKFSKEIIELEKSIYGGIECDFRGIKKRF